MGSLHLRFPVGAACFLLHLEQNLWVGAMARRDYPHKKEILEKISKKNFYFKYASYKLLLT
jgi:hypothetical protein